MSSRDGIVSHTTSSRDGIVSHTTSSRDGIVSHTSSSRDGIVSHTTSSKDNIVSRKALNHTISIAAPNLAQPSIKLIFFSQFPSFVPSAEKIEYFILLCYFFQKFTTTRNEISKYVIILTL